MLIFQSGLTTASLDSNYTVSSAENLILDIIKPHTVEGKNPLAGNSVYMDKVFLMKYMPALVSHLHYRIIDVSTVKELCRRWDKTCYRKAPQKILSHRAIDDIRESITELKYYKSFMFNSGSFQ